MAYISSTFNTTNTYVKYRLVVDLLSQDIVNNTSTVNVQLQAWRTNTGYETYGTGTASVNVEGTQFNQAVSSSQKITYNSFTVIYNANHTIAHNADGTKSPSIGGYFTINAPVSGGWNYFSFSLPTIPRASTVTATNAEIESATSININRFSESFTHILKYSFGTLSGTVATGVATGYGWTVPSTFYAQIPNAKSGVCTITCETYSGETLIGSSTTTFTASVNETTNAPTVSASIIDTNAVTKALTDSDYKVVKFFSNMGFSITATAKNSATISSRSITCGSLSSTSTSGTLSAVESNVFVVTATDSRGIQSSITYNATSTPAYPLVDYVRLTVSPTLTRTSPTGSTIAISYSGNYYNGTFGTVANTLTVKYRYRIAGTSTWSSDVTITPTKSGNTYSGSQNLADSFPYTNAYEFEVSAYDKLNTSGEVTVPLVVSQGIPVFDWNKTAFNVNVATNVPSLTVGSKYLEVGSTGLLVNGNSLQKEVLAETCFLPVDFNLFRCTTNTAGGTNVTIPLTKVKGNLTLASNLITLTKGYLYELDVNFDLETIGAAQITIANPSNVSQLDRSQHACTTDAHAGFTSTTGYGIIDLTSAGSDLQVKALVVATTPTPPYIGSIYGQLVIRKMKKITI